MVLADAMRMRDLALFVLLLVALLGVLHVWPPIATRGEAREGLVVQELAGGGDWVLPRRQGVIASKPPLYHWLAAGAVRAFGWSDAAVRLPSALGAWLTALVTFALGLLLVADRRVAWLAVGILFACWGFARSALEARVDMLFTACVAASIAGIAWWALRDARPGRTLCWLAAAAAVLVKGPAGAVLPGLVALAFLASGHELGRLAGLWSWGAAAAAGVIAGGWYVAAIATGGRDFLAVQLLKENVHRFAGRGEFAPHRAFAWLLMPRYFLGHLAPWHLAVVDDARRRWRGEPATAGGRLLHCWWIVFLVVFTVAAGKRAVYLLPLYPAIALLAARALSRRVSSRAGWALLGAGVAATALAVAAITYRVQLGEVEWQGALPLARAVRVLVPPGASLHASMGLSESDVLVFAYLLERPLLRRRVTCDGSDAAASYYLRPVVSGSGAMPVARIAWARDLELVRCDPIRAKSLDSPSSRGVRVQE